MIIVTGASKGLGRTICDRLTSKGLPVLGISRNISLGPFKSISCDVSSYESVKGVARKLRDDNVLIEGIVNAAGIASMNLALTTPKTIIEKIIYTNLLGTIYCCQLFSPLMLRNKRGSIINFSTIAVALGLKGESVYAASKAGVEGFTRAFAREMADFNIKVNCIAPGPIDTDLISGVSADKIEKIVSQQIIPRKFSPESIADMVEILFDRRSDSISGQVLHIGGV